MSTKLRVRKNPRDVALSLLSRDVVQRTAQIIGPSSAAARALRRADEIGPTARFWSTGASIIVTDGLPGDPGSAVEHGDGEFP